MWTRKELKQRARARIKINYLSCILAALILIIAFGSSQAETVYQAGNLSQSEILQIPQVRQIQQLYQFSDAEILAEYSLSEMLYRYMMGPVQVIWSNLFLFLGGAFTTILLILKILVINPLEVGGCAFFTQNTEGMPGIGSILKGYKKETFYNVTMILFFRDLYLILWDMLFYFPGVYKRYEYCMVPYILSDNPALSKQDAFRISREMMYGQKMNTFILDLSFLLWQLFSVITFGLAGIFFGNPYKFATKAELYMVLKERYWSQNQSSPDIYVNVRGEM